MRSTTGQRFLWALAALAIAAAGSAALAASPRLSEVRKIHFGHFKTIGHNKRGRMVVLAHGSQEDVRKRLTAALVSSGRFSVVAKEEDADARLEGAAGYVHSEDAGTKHTTGFADLKLVDRKTGEILWVFEYQPHAGAGGSAGQRVADQAVENLLAEAKRADAR
jgi:curli biogenesis system outer membrane secretion channel CsgG